MIRQQLLESERDINLSKKYKSSTLTTSREIAND